MDATSYIFNRKDDVKIKDYGYTEVIATGSLYHR